MAVAGFKWLLLPFAGLVLMAGKNPEPHPIHISVIEINHNPTDKTLEISCKIFTDDFEKILTKNYKAKTDLTNPPNKAAMDTLVKKYILSHLLIKADGRIVPIQYVGFESEGDAVYSYVECVNVPSVKKVEVSSNLMYDMFDDETIIIHTIVGGKRVSNKMEFPAKESSFSF